MEADNSPPRNGAVDLDALLKPKHVTLKGVKHEVKDVDGIGYQLLVQLKAEGPEKSVVTMYAIAKRCLPTVSEDEVDKLSAAQVGAVVELAAQNAETIEATIPKARPAGRKGATSP